MSRLRRPIDRALALVIVAFMAVLVVTVLWQVASRYVFAQPSPWTEELARFLLIWVTLLGAAYLSGQQGHIAIDLLSQRLSTAGALRLQRFIQVAIGLFALGVLCIGGINLIHITLTLGQSSAVLGVPLGYVYAVIPLSGALMVFYSAADFLDARPPDTHPVEGSA